MKITDVEAIYVRPTQFRQRSDSSQDSLIIKVLTDEGITGYGEVDSSPLIAKAIVEAPFSHTLSCGLREIVVGQDPFQYEKIWQDMVTKTSYIGREGAVIQTAAGIDLAIWDIIGKALNRPVYELMGGGFSKAIKAYASAMFSFTPEETAERAKGFVEEGFKAVKFGWEPMGADPELDEALVRAVREAVGDHVEVLIDAGQAWDLKTAMNRVKRFEPYNIYWLEEPLKPGNLRGYSRLAQATSMRIAAGEQECTRVGFARLMDQGNIDVIQIDLTRVGLTQAKKIAYDAHERNLPCVNHNFTTDINTAASLHLLASIPNSVFLEYCVEESMVRQKVVKNPIEIVDGYARVPRGPGLGVELDQDFIKEHS